MLFPMTEEEKPHWGLRPIRSIGTYRLASLTRFANSSLDSSSDFFVETSPKTINLSSGRAFNASNEPERSSSYSSSNL